MTTNIYVQPGDWVRLPLIPAIYGISECAARAYIKRGLWAIDVHYRKDPVNRLIFNTRNISAWLKS